MDQKEFEILLKTQRQIAQKIIEPIINKIKATIEKEQRRDAEVTLTFKMVSKDYSRLEEQLTVCGRSLDSFLCNYDVQVLHPNVFVQTDLVKIRVVIPARGEHLATLSFEGA